MGIGKRLAQLLDERGTNVHEVALATGISPSTLYSVIQRDSMSANIHDLALVARQLNVDLEYFSGMPESSSSEPLAAPNSEERTWLQQLREMDAHGRGVITWLMGAETERMRNERLGPAFDAGAPSAVSDGEGCSRASSLDVRSLKDKGWLLSVTDNCMEPDFEKGDLLVVWTQSELEIGQPGIFRLGGKVYFRKLGNGALLASNPHFPPILTPPATNLRTLGKVIGRIRLPSAEPPPTDTDKEG